MKKNKGKQKQQPYNKRPELPKSCTSLPINCVGLVSFLLSIYILRGYSDLSNIYKIIIVMAAYTMPIMILELIFLKTYRRATTAYNFSSAKPINWKILAIKLTGFYFTFAVVAGLYSILPEYQGGFYNEFWAFLKVTLPYLFVLAVPYFIILERYNESSNDGSYQAGLLFLLKWENISGRTLRQYALGWLVKAFFLPLMYIYLIGNVNYLINVDIGQAFSQKNLIFKFFWELLYGIDLIIVSTGYIFAIRVLDSHIRSAEPTFPGWFWALMCYQPLWSVISNNYLKYNSDGYSWGNWLFHTDFMYAVWAGAIIFCTAIYAFASVSFGLRFSNLTHRGILTNGVYRYTKHPAYVSKCISWWLIAIPFVVHPNTTPLGALRDCLLLLGVNAIYYFRAKTEENHLSNDPVYVEYALAMNKRSIFRGTAKLFPFLKYKPTPSQI